MSAAAPPPAPPKSRRRRGRRAALRDYEWPVVWVIAFLTLVLGAWGFWLWAARGGGDPRLPEVTYRSLQLFVLESGDVPPPVPWPLQVARFLAPMVAVYTASKALAVIFRGQLERARVRTWRGHVVVCGLGRKGERLTRLLAERRPRRWWAWRRLLARLGLARPADGRGTPRHVVAIERHPGNPAITACRESGAVVVEGDATDPRTLERAGLARADFLVALCDDGTNAEIAMQASDWLHEQPGRREGGPLRCVVHLFDPELWELLRQQETTGGDELFRLQLCNVLDGAARVLLARHPPFPRPAGATAERPPHVLLVGVGRLGETLLVQAARAWWRERRGEGRLRVTVVDRVAGERMALLTQRYPRLAEACGVATVDADTRSPQFERGDFLGLDDSRTRVSIAYVCLGDEPLAVTAALSLRARLAPFALPVVVRLAEEGGFARLLAGGWRRAFPHLHGFPLLDEACRPELLLAGLREALARAAHAAYRRLREAQGETPTANPSLAPWDDLDASYRESSLQHADHLGAKLRWIGREPVPTRDWGAAPEELTAEEVELLARAEHERFVAERLAAGWRWTSGPKDT
ncbi:MAG TPA: NAD-binding protein, partial [Thermoanaerobaculia bacterium]|nr:NAD-binding protein [Thermoanaerobaculia bacterium]